MTYLQTWEEPEYKEIFKRAELRLTPERAYVIINALNHALNLDGDIIEMGVYKGSTAYLIADTMKDTQRILHLFDTFEGTPEHSDKDNTNRTGWYSDTSLEGVQEFLSDFRFIKYHKGFIPKTFQPLEQNKYAFVHIHLNLFESTDAALRYIYEMVSTGGIILIEDYGLIKCSGVKLAVDSFVRELGISVIHLPTSQGMIIKI